MSNEQAPASVPTLGTKSVLAELEVPFPPDQVQWRVTNTAKDKKRGQIVPYADPRAYADRLIGTKHIRRLRGGSQAQLMSADDGHEYVVKFKGKSFH